MRYQSRATAPRRAVVHDAFLSVDFGHAPSHVHLSHSPNCKNVIRDEYGKIRRRMGYFRRFGPGAKIWGLAKWGADFIVHSGAVLYRMTPAGESTQLYSGMQEAHSQFFRYGGRLYVLDGGGLYSYDGETCAPVAGKVPRVIIAGSPNGGGVAFEQVNLICDSWEQSFCGTQSDTVYQLAFGDLDGTPVRVRRARLEGGQVVWDELTQDTHFTVDRGAGRVIFAYPPGLPVYQQEDNVIVTASKDRSSQRGRIFGCTVLKGFGVGGHENQLFLTANPGYPNRVFWSAVGDISYFGDLQYAALGQDDSAVMALSAQGSHLIAHKDEKSSQSYLCSVFLTEINGIQVPQMQVERAIGGGGCIARYAGGYLGEPLYLSQLGVQAVTYKDLTGQEIETLRGERISRRLLAEPGLSGAVAVVYKYFYLIAVNSRVYVLDRLSPQGEAGVLSNDYQYNAFFWDHIPACCFLVDGEKLLFGTPDGQVMEFYTDETAPASYNDDGETYEWFWEFPEYVGSLFYLSKAISRIALRAKAYKRSSVAVDVQIGGQWKEILNDRVSFGYLDLDDLDLNNLNLFTDITPKKTWAKYAEARLDKFAFRVRGSRINEPFGLYSFAYEVKEGGRHKG